MKKCTKSKQNSIIEQLFNVKADELAEKFTHLPTEDKERFLDMVSNVTDEDLKQRLINQYLKDEDYLGSECGRLTKLYYENGFIDGAILIIECMNGGGNNDKTVR